MSGCLPHGHAGRPPPRRHVDTAAQLEPFTARRPAAAGPVSFAGTAQLDTVRAERQLADQSRAAPALRRARQRHAVFDGAVAGGESEHGVDRVGGGGGDGDAAVWVRDEIKRRRVVGVHPSAACDEPQLVAGAEGIFHVVA